MAESNMKRLHEAWTSSRALYTAIGVPRDLLAKGDALVALGESAGLDAPTSYRAAWVDFDAELQASAQDAIRQKGEPWSPTDMAAAFAVRDLMQATAARQLAEADTYLGTARGAQYLSFAQWGKAGLGDDALFKTLVLALPRLPEISRIVVDAKHSPLAETRIKLLAQSILNVVETFYRPLLALVWRLSCHALGSGDPLKPATTTGKLMSTIRKLWDVNSGAVRADDFIYFPANDVRIGAGHPSQMHYDVTTKELVLKLENVVHRLDEAQLGQRHGEVFHRSRTMHFAFLRAAAVEREVLTGSKGAEPPPAS